MARVRRAHSRETRPRFTGKLLLTLPPKHRILGRSTPTLRGQSCRTASTNSDPREESLSFNPRVSHGIASISLHWFTNVSEISQAGSKNVYLLAVLHITMGLSFQICQMTPVKPGARLSVPLIGPSATLPSQAYRVPVPLQAPWRHHLPHSSSWRDILVLQSINEMIEWHQEYGGGPQEPLGWRDRQYKGTFGQSQVDYWRGSAVSDGPRSLLRHQAVLRRHTHAPGGPGELQPH